MAKKKTKKKVKANAAKKKPKAKKTAGKKKKTVKKKTKKRLTKAGAPENKMSSADFCPQTETMSAMPEEDVIETETDFEEQTETIAP